MKVTYYISTGTPCEIPSGISGVSIKEALVDFKAYIEECDRFGNPWNDAHLTITGDLIEERLYVVTKRKTIKREM